MLPSCLLLLCVVEWHQGACCSFDGQRVRTCYDPSGRHRPCSGGKDRRVCHPRFCTSERQKTHWISESCCRRERPRNPSVHRSCNLCGLSTLATTTRVPFVCATLRPTGNDNGLGKEPVRVHRRLKLFHNESLHVNHTFLSCCSTQGKGKQVRSADVFDSTALEKSSTDGPLRVCCWIVSAIYSRKQSFADQHVLACPWQFRLCTPRSASFIARCLFSTFSARDQAQHCVSVIVSDMFILPNACLSAPCCTWVCVCLKSLQLCAVLGFADCTVRECLMLYVICSRPSRTLLVLALSTALELSLRSAQFGMFRHVSWVVCFGILSGVGRQALHPQVPRLFRPPGGLLWRRRDCTTGPPPHKKR